MKVLFILLLVSGITGAALYFSASGARRISSDADMLQLGKFALQEKRFEDAFKWYQYAANQGLSKGQFHLSVLYQRGQGVLKDESLAVEWMSRAAKQGLAQAEYEYALMLEFGRGVEKAKPQMVAKWYKKSAVKHYPEAMLKLAKLYFLGQGLERNVGQAMKWVTLAEKKHVSQAATFRQEIAKETLTRANAGDHKAQYMMATWYRDGIGVEQSKEMALALFTDAAKQGNAQAEYELAKILVTSGSSEDVAQALYWFEKAADQGHEQAGAATVAMLAKQSVVGARAKNAWRWLYYGLQRREPQAQYNLAVVFKEGLLGLASQHVDVGIWLKEAAQGGIAQAQNDYAVYLKLQQQDTRQAIAWFSKAARLDGKAQFNLGFIYARGDGVTPDDDSAVRLWRLAVDHGSTRAKMMLGLFYDLGRGVGRSESSAVQWYQKAAELGDVDALYNLAVLYYNGRGIDRDFKQASKYFKILAEMGDLSAQNIYGSLFLDGQGVDYAPNIAVKWFQQAARAGNDKAMFNLATQYRRGHGLPQDDTLAIKWYKKSAQLGFVPAQNALGYMYAEGRGVTVDKTTAHQWFEKASFAGLDMAGSNLEALLHGGNFALAGLQVDNVLRSGMIEDKEIDLSKWLEVHTQPIL